MARGNIPLQVFNRGRISRLALARTDIERTGLSAETQTNWMPRVLGSMMFRPGLGYIGATLSNNKARFIPFIRSLTDFALVEITDSTTRIWVSDAVVQRSDITPASGVRNETFDTDLTNWTDDDEAGTTSQWVTGGYMGLTGTRYARARRWASWTVTSLNEEHAVKVTVERGVVNFKMGTSASLGNGVEDDDYISERELHEGTYSFTFTPTAGTVHLEFSSNTEYESLVDSCVLEAASNADEDLTLPTPWLEADLDEIRYEQSADVIYVGAEGYQQYKIVRYGVRDWAIVKYQADDGPFRTINTTQKRINPTALSGNVTLEADKPVFNANHAGALFEVTSIGQQVSVTPAGTDQWSNAIRVTGVNLTRRFDILVTSSTGFDATVRVQRSVGEVGSWSNVTGLLTTSTVATTYNDALDNQIIFYRVGVGSTYTSGSPVCTLTYDTGGITGIARVTAFNEATASTAIVLSNFGSTAPSELWSEGAWSTERGFPSAVVIHEGRLCWGGKGSIWCSVSDAYETFDSDYEGDAGPISRSIGAGPVDTIEWLASLGRLVIGGQGTELQAKTSSLEEPLSPTNFSLKDISTQGSAAVGAVKIDNRLLFIQKNGIRVFEIGANETTLDMQSEDRSMWIPEIGEPSIIRMGVQRQPDTRIHCVRSDGTVAVLIYDFAEGTLAWVDVTTGDADGTNGVIEDVVVLPGTTEDAVYYLVKRMINGAEVRYLEKWALETEGRGTATTKLTDSHAVFESTTATTTVTGADHLVNETGVSVWGNSKDLGTVTVSSTGDFTISEASTTVVYGLPYVGTYISSKLAYGGQMGTALTQPKKISQLAMVLADTHAQGLKYGPSTSVLDPLPIIDRSAARSTDAIIAAHDSKAVSFPGRWDTDSRLVLLAESPRPVTALGVVMSIETKER